MGYYLKVRFDEKYKGRKIWYFNNTYLCDCVNTTFETKEECESWIDEVKRWYSYPHFIYAKIESITLHKRRY